MKETRSSETASSAPQSGLRALVGSVFTGDRVLWIIIAALAVISVLVVYSSTAKMAYDAHTARSTAHFLRQQVGILILCVPIIVIVHKINCRVYNRLAQPVYVLSLLLTLAVYFIGATTNGAARWIPVAGFQFQPSEALKVATSCCWHAAFRRARARSTASGSFRRSTPSGGGGPRSARSGARGRGPSCCPSCCRVR